MKRNISTLLVGLLLLSATLACGSSSVEVRPEPLVTTMPEPVYTPYVPPSEPTDTPQPTGVPVPMSHLPGLGSVLEQQGYSLCVLAVEDPATRLSRFYDGPEAGKKVVAVEVVVGNISGEQFTSNPLDATMVDAEGFMYSVELGSAEDQIGCLDVSPGERVRGWVGFVVPEDSVPASLKYNFKWWEEITLQVGLTNKGG